jgi:hypothetical protein
MHFYLLTLSDIVNAASFFLKGFDQKSEGNLRMQPLHWNFNLKISEILFWLENFFPYRPAFVKTETRPCRASNSMSNCSVLQAPSKPGIYPREWQQKCTVIMSISHILFICHIMFCCSKLGQSFGRVECVSAGLAQNSWDVSRLR